MISSPQQQTLKCVGNTAENPLDQQKINENKDSPYQSPVLLPPPSMDDPSQNIFSKSTKDSPHIVNIDQQIPFLQEVEILKDSEGNFKLQQTNRDEIVSNNKINNSKNIHDNQIYENHKINNLQQNNKNTNDKKINNILKSLKTNEKNDKQNNSKELKNKHKNNQPKMQSPIILERKNSSPYSKDMKNVFQIAGKTTKESLNDIEDHKQDNKKITNTKMIVTDNIIQDKYLLFSKTEDYHKTPIFCETLYQDDCFLKKISDLIFQFLYLPIRMSIFLLRLCYACLVDDDEEQDIPSGQEQQQQQQQQPNDQNNQPCYVQCHDFFYCPFKCCGDWVNQCSYSMNRFCCKSLWFIPDKFRQIFTTNNIKCCLQFGLFFKTCCLTNDFCQQVFNCFGNCLAILCIPQGACEKVFAFIKRITCNIINSSCILKIFSCFSKEIILTNKNNDNQNKKEIILKYCCGCAMESTGDIENIEQYL